MCGAFFVLYSARSFLQIATMQDVLDWLQNPTDYNVGLALFRALSPKAPILLVLQSGETTYNTIRLKRELEQLARAKSEISKPVPTASPVSVPAFKQKNLGIHLKKGAYPPQLHPAYDRLMDLYAMVDVLHPRLELLWNGNRKQCIESVRAIVDAWNEIKGIYRILDYWTENKRILPNDYEEKPNTIPATVEDLIRRRNNLRTYISKHKKSPSKTIEVNAWKEELAAIDAKLNYEQRTEITGH